MQYHSQITQGKPVFHRTYEHNKTSERLSMHNTNLSLDLQTPPIWQEYTRDEWWKLRSEQANKPLNRSATDLLRRLAGTNEVLSAQEIRRIYHPLAGLILERYRTMTEQTPQQNLLIIGISGSVAVGKSTGARLLTELLRREQIPVELITTDNFLKPNHQLESEGLLRRKGFPESYDQSVIAAFLNDIKMQKPAFSIPTYDHIAYTILQNQRQIIHRPAILVLEGVNVLQGDIFPLDYKLYFDADPATIKQWYVNRFLTFRQKAFLEPGAYFERYATLDDQQATAVACDLWDSINLINLQENIAPSKHSADCILHKNIKHQVHLVQQRLEKK